MNENSTPRGAEALSDAAFAGISAMLHAGKKIAAIKAYRTATGAGLADAKDMVELIERTLRQTEPEKFTAPVSKGGCFAVVILLLVPAAVLAVVR